MANILIADADAAMRRTLSESLRSFGHNLLTAEDAEQALSQVRGEIVHVLLCDADLPGRDAAELIQEVRQIRPRTSVVALVGLGENSARYSSAGAFAALSKPFNLQALRRIVTEAAQQATLAPSDGGTAHPAADMRKKRGFVPVLKWALGAMTVGILAGALMFGARWWQRSRDPAGIFVVPYAHLSGMALHEGTFWACDWFNQSIYRHQRDAVLSLAKTFIKEEWHPSALAWDGVSLWSYSSWERRLSKHQLDEQLTIVQDFPLDAIEPTGLSHDGEWFWFADAKKASIGRFAIRDGKIEIQGQRHSPAYKPVGIVRHGDFIWTADAETGLLYKHDPAKDLEVVATYAPPDDLLIGRIACLASDDRALWIGARDGQKVFRVPEWSLKRTSVR